MLELCCHQECEFIYEYPDGSQRAKRVLPRKVYWGTTVGYSGEAWFLQALDFEDHEEKDFQLKSIVVPGDEIPPENITTVSRNGHT